MGLIPHGFQQNFWKVAPAGGFLRMGSVVAKADTFLLRNTVVILRRETKPGQRFVSLDRWRRGVVGVGCQLWFLTLRPLPFFVCRIMSTPPRHHQNIVAMNASGAPCDSSTPSRRRGQKYPPNRPGTNGRVYTSRRSISLSNSRPLNDGAPSSPAPDHRPDSTPPDAQQLLSIVYDELRRLAAAKLSRESPGQTLQPTALVHEAWLRLGGENQPAWQNRAHFFAAAAESMRRILVDNARRKRAIRHGGELARVDADATGFDLPEEIAQDDELLLINDAIDALAAHDPRKAELVKQRYFAGFTLEETAETLGISARTAKRDWAYARAWLFNEVKRLRG